MNATSSIMDKHFAISFSLLANENVHVIEFDKNVGCERPLSYLIAKPRDRQRNRPVSSNNDRGPYKTVKHQF